MKIFMTGASGFIGSHLLQKLLEDGHTVNALYRTLPSHNIPGNLHCFKGDVQNIQSVKEAMNGCQVVYHTAALAKMWTTNKEDFYTANVQGTADVLEAALQCNIKKVVFTSSCGVIGPSLLQPMTENDPRIISFRLDYERSKHMAEIVCHEYVQKGLNVVIVNPSRVFGSSNNTANGFDKMIRSYISGKWHFMPGDATKIANYAYVHDVVKGHLLAMHYGKTGERYILGGENLSYTELFNKIKKVTGLQYRLLQLPFYVIKLLSYIQLTAYYLTGKHPTLTPPIVDRLKYNSIISCDKAKEQLGYIITPFEEALSKSLKLQSLKYSDTQKPLQPSVAI